MATIIMSEEVSDTDAVLSSLVFDCNWLVEISNQDPDSLVGREEALFKAMNVLQFVCSRFARIGTKAVAFRR